MRVQVWNRIKHHLTALTTEELAIHCTDSPAFHRRLTVRAVHTILFAISDPDRTAEIVAPKSCMAARFTFGGYAINPTNAHQECGATDSNYVPCAKVLL